MAPPGCLRGGRYLFGQVESQKRRYLQAMASFPKEKKKKQRIQGRCKLGWQNVTNVPGPMNPRVHLLVTSLELKKCQGKILDEILSGMFSTFWRFSKRHKQRSHANSFASQGCQTDRCAVAAKPHRAKESFFDHPTASCARLFECNCVISSRLFWWCWTPSPIFFMNVAASPEWFICAIVQRNKPSGSVAQFTSVPKLDSFLWL